MEVGLSIPIHSGVCMQHKASASTSAKFCFSGVSHGIVDSLEGLRRLDIVPIRIVVVEHRSGKVAGNSLEFDLTFV